MRALTIHQPWATLIASGAKAHETRGMAPPAAMIGCRIAIHAGKSINSLMEIQDYLVATNLRDEHPAQWIEEIIVALKGSGISRLTDLPLGAILCTAMLAGAYRCGATLPSNGQTLVTSWAPGSPQRGTFMPDAYGDYSPGRWAWHLTDVQCLPTPVPARGQQGFWPWDGGTA